MESAVFDILRMRLFLAGPAAVQLTQKHSIDVQGILVVQYSHLYKFPMYTFVPADTREDPSPKANAPALVAKKNKTQRIQPPKKATKIHIRESLYHKLDIITSTSSTPHQPQLRPQRSERLERQHPPRAWRACSWETRRIWSRNIG